MIETLAEAGISILTLTTVWMIGDKDKNAPVMGVLAEIAWFMWIISYEHWGLLVLNLPLVVMYIRMYYKWNAR
jgi:hypothetical protein